MTRPDPDTYEIPTLLIGSRSALRVPCARACGHIEHFPIILAEKKAEEIKARKCHDCRVADAKAEEERRDAEAIQRSRIARALDPRTNEEIKAAELAEYFAYWGCE